MTSVVGILNQRGAAIAADSAVTRTRFKRDERILKVTKNGNKMLRLCEAEPISVMVTGNADFLRTPWDVIIRRYRQLHGNKEHPTVLAAAHDLFNFIQSEPMFWDERLCGRHLVELARDSFHEVTDNLGFEETMRKRDGTLLHPRSFVKSFVKACTSFRKWAIKNGKCPSFTDYSFAQFRLSSERLLNDFFLRLTEKEGCIPKKSFPGEVIDGIRPAFEELLWTLLTCRYRSGSSATLIFTGFGYEQVYPSLVPVHINEGFDTRVCYHIREQDIVNISDQRPVAICPFAQKDVIRALLRGIHSKWSRFVCDSFFEMTDFRKSGVFAPLEGEEAVDQEFFDLLDEVKTEDLQDSFVRKCNRRLDANQRTWEKALADYDLPAMASLADSLIGLTGFHRIMTFSEESVGGLVDVAVISKNDGFNWIRRKSWYHKDPEGKDGQFGI